MSFKKTQRRFKETHGETVGAQRRGHAEALALVEFMRTNHHIMPDRIDVILALLDDGTKANALALGRIAALNAGDIERVLIGDCPHLCLAATPGGELLLLHDEADPPVTPDRVEEDDAASLRAYRLQLDNDVSHERALMYRTVAVGLVLTAIILVRQLAVTWL